MKKILFIVVFIILIVSLYAENPLNRRLFIEGTASDREHLEYFLWNFNEEAVGAGYSVTFNKEEAAYIFRFDVSPNRARLSQQIPPNNNLFVIRISLIRIEEEGEFELVTFDFFFSDLDEMYEHNRFLFLSAANNIPPLTEDDLIIIQHEDTRWREGRLYLRASFDYPLRFYSLQPEGLIAGSGIYTGTYEIPDTVSQLDHKIIVLPGITLGIEVYLIEYVSLEANFQVFMGDPSDNLFLNFAAGVELRFPIPVRNFLVSPYGAFSYILRVSDLYHEYPPFAFGGGLQVAARGGANSMFFIDAKFMFSLTDAVRYNPYIPLYTLPEHIHYRRYFLGLGIGYKYGFFNRNR